MSISETLTKEFELKKWQVENTIALLDDDNTVPFIARYRKEATGGMDDQLLRAFCDRLQYLRSLEEQKEKVIASITEQGKMTADILKAIENAVTLTEIEDIYRPFRPKRKTRASVAKEKGLEPLALEIYKQKADFDPFAEAENYINDDVETVEEAINGAKDIIAETVSDDAEGRKQLRWACKRHGSIKTAGVKEKFDDPKSGASRYNDYKDYEEPVFRIKDHRVLAINRGEKEGFIKVWVELDKDYGTDLLKGLHIKRNSAPLNPCSQLVSEAVEDAYTRLVFPSIEREIRNELTEKASKDSIKVFSKNTSDLLMQPPVKGRATIGLDPGYRTGCKVAVVDENGKVLDTAVIFVTGSLDQWNSAKKTIKKLVRRYNVTLFAIGNGTASHETEVFAATVIKEINEQNRGKNPVAYAVVSEAGASVYSASSLAAEEFPQYDVTIRSAVSIARRLQDPLSELVKIDPAAIGVGQYQHDMPKKELAMALDNVVEDCVNSVGVDLNTASAALLTRVAGVSPSVAKNIVSYREKNGSFKSREQLKDVPKLGPKAFEQCAGFLRITDGENFLDSTAIHPESYETAEKLIKLCNAEQFESGALTAGYNLESINNAVAVSGTSALASELQVGEPTLKDIILEFNKPGRDPRDEMPQPILREDVINLEDLKPGMELTGTVRNVVDFGAFVDVGVHEDGLLHISQVNLAKPQRGQRATNTERLKNTLKVGDIINVWVLDVDLDRKRISLTMKEPEKKKQ